MLALLQELLAFAKHNRKLWLLPVLLVLVGLSGLLVLTQGSVMAPFIYTLF